MHQTRALIVGRNAPDLEPVLQKGRMKTQDGIRQTLKKFKPILKDRFKVKQIGIFGSYVRGEESPESDIDILVEFSEPIGWEFIDVKEFLEEILGRKVHVATPGSLKPRLRDRILREIVYA